MDSYDSNHILILLDFSRSTKFAILCTAQIAKFQEKRVTILAVLNNLFKIIHSNLHFSNLKRVFLSKFWWNFVGISRRCSEFLKNFQFLEKKDQIFRKNPWKFRKCSNYSEDYSKLFSRVPNDHFYSRLLGAATCLCGVRKRGTARSTSSSSSQVSASGTSPSHITLF